MTLKVPKHPLPLLNDSSLVFLTTARIYARLHDDWRIIKHHVKVGGCVRQAQQNCAFAFGLADNL